MGDNERKKFESMLFTITKPGVLGKAPENKRATSGTKGKRDDHLSKIRPTLSLFNEETREHKRWERSPALNSIHNSAPIGVFLFRN
jgi:hypothetical protein